MLRIRSIQWGGKDYALDAEGFLAYSSDWDEGFAQGMAQHVGLPGGLTEKHWRVIRFIRDTYEQRGVCPLVYETCRANGLHLTDLKHLFPSGYQRGACRLAGITYREGYVIGLGYAWAEPGRRDAALTTPEKTYRIDGHGFLVDHSEWDEAFAVARAYEMKMPELLTKRHWQIIRYLREAYERDHVIPTVYETCETQNLKLEELAHLFPDGYHRGAVKIAGLRIR
jgi:tRNA 2-thiouridine synthesizing protein E